MELIHSRIPRDVNTAPLQVHFRLNQAVPLPSKYISGCISLSTSAKAVMLRVREISTIWSFGGDTHGISQLLHTNDEIMPRNVVLPLLTHLFQFHGKKSRRRTDSSVIYNVCRWFSKVTYLKMPSSTVYNSCFCDTNTSQIWWCLLLYTALLARCTTVLFPPSSLSLHSPIFYLSLAPLLSIQHWRAGYIAWILPRGYSFSKFLEDLYETRYCTQRAKEIKQYFISFWLSFPFIISIMMLTSVSWK